MSCKFCEDEKIGKLHAGMGIIANDYRGQCNQCGGDVQIHEVNGWYLGRNRYGSHVLYVFPVGYRCNACGDLFSMVALLCGDIGLNVTSEFIIQDSQI